MHVDPKLDSCCVLCGYFIILHVGILALHVYKALSEKVTLNMLLIVHTVSLSHRICQSLLRLGTFFFSTLNCERTHV